MTALRFCFCFAAWFVSVAACLAGEKLKPDVAKLAPVPPCPALIAAAGSNHIIIEGIDSPAADGDATLTPGDSATALITLVEKGERRTQWLLVIEAATPTARQQQQLANITNAASVWYVGAGDKVEFPSHLTPATLRLLGPFEEVRGKAKSVKIEDKTAHAVVNQGSLAIGINEAAAAFYRMTQDHLHMRGNFQTRNRPFTEGEVAAGRKGMAEMKMTTNEARAILGSQMALMSYFSLVQRIPGLEDIMLKVVKPPSIWSVVGHLGVKVRLELLNESVAPVETPAWNLPLRKPSWQFPLALKVNDQPALIVNFIVAEPRPPLLSCGGIIGFLAERPNDPNTWLLLQIISAHHQGAK